MSSAPAWVYGIILNLISIRTLGSVFSGGTFGAWPTEFTLAYVPMVLRQMILPFLAIFLSGLFQSVYAWRMFFLIYSNEDRVEMAKSISVNLRPISCFQPVSKKRRVLSLNRGYGHCFSHGPGLRSGPCGVILDL
jgi:ABC-type dipeptide/oligopeptide/nickel transport system permease component